MNQEQWQAIAGYLNNRGHHLDLSVMPLELSGGVANFNYRTVMDGKKVVLRRPPSGPLPPGANDIAREFKVLSQLTKHYPPAPNGLIFCDDESVIGVPFCISEFREGICIGRDLPESLQHHPSIGDSLSRLTIEALAALHKVDLQKTNLEDLGNIDGFLERQIGGWFKRGTRVLSTEQLKQLAVIRDYLQNKLPQQRIGVLVHNDFKLDNMLIDISSMQVNGVVDWDMCTIGDPFYELAILLSYWGSRNDPAAYQFQCRMPMEADGWWPRKNVIKQYLLLTGFSISEEDMVFYQWLAQYRTIVVYAQLNSLFKRTGTYPAALSEDECNNMEKNIQILLDHVVKAIKAD